MLEPNAPPAATPPAPRPAPAPGTSPAVQPSAPPAAKAPPGAAPAEAEASEVADDDADEAGDAQDWLSREAAAQEGAEQEAEDAGQRQTPEQRAADTPATPDDYVIEVPGLDARNDPIAQNFTGVAADLGLSNREVNSLAGWFLEQGQQLQQQRMEADKADRAVLLRTTAETWGGEARSNQQAVKSVLGSLPAELRQAIRGARVGGDPAAPLLINQAPFLELLAELGRYRGGDVHQATEADLVEQAKVVQRTDFDRYVREGWDKRLASLMEKRAARSSVQQEGPRPGDAAREKQIMRTLRSNHAQYVQSGMSEELAAIRQRRAGRS